MARPRGGFGFGVLIVVVAVVLFLAARAWRSAAPAAIQALDASSASTLDDQVRSEAANALSSGELPDLADAKQQADAHARELQQAVSETE